MSSVMVISDLAMEASAYFLMWGVFMFVMYVISWRGAWMQPIRRMYFGICLLCILAALLFLLGPWFKEPVGGRLIDTAYTLSKQT